MRILLVFCLLWITGMFYSLFWIKSQALCVDKRRVARLVFMGICLAGFYAAMFSNTSLEATAINTEWISTFGFTSGYVFYLMLIYETFLVGCERGRPHGKAPNQIATFLFHIVYVSSWLQHEIAPLERRTAYSAGIETSGEFSER